MADLKECFPSLSDSVTGEGECLTARQEGEAASGSEGSIGFSFKDSSGNVVLPQLTAAGKLPVDTEGLAGTCKSANGEVAAGSATAVDVATITLTASKDYHKVEALGSCFRESIFQIVHNDNAVESVVAEFLVGPGQYSFQVSMDCLDIVAGATGTQELKLKAYNLDKLSSLRGSISALEVA